MSFLRVSRLNIVLAVAGVLLFHLDDGGGVGTDGLYLVDGDLGPGRRKPLHHHRPCTGPGTHSGACRSLRHRSE